MSVGIIKVKYETHITSTYLDCTQLLHRHKVIIVGCYTGRDL